jgi:hypothetical protein
MSLEGISQLRRLQVVTIALILAAIGFLGWDWMRRQRAAAPENGAARAAIMALEGRVDGLERGLAEARARLVAIEDAARAQAERADGIGTRLLEEVERARRASAAIRVVPADRRLVVQYRRGRQTGFGARVLEVRPEAKDAFVEAAGLAAAGGAPELQALSGPEALLPLEGLDLARLAGGPFGEGLLFVSATIRANNDAGELASRPNRLWLACSDRGRQQTFDLAGPFFLAAKRTEEDSLAKSIANTAVLRAGPGARLSLGIDADAQRLTADGVLDVYVRIGPLLILSAEPRND